MTDMEMAALEQKIDALATEAETLWTRYDAAVKAHGVWSDEADKALIVASRADDARDAVSREYRIAVEA